MSNIFRSKRSNKSNFKKNKISYLALLCSVITAVIILNNSWDKPAIAYADDSKEEVAEAEEVYKYSIDDLRNLLNMNRNCGERNRQSIILRANTLDLSAGDKEKLSNCLGSMKYNVEPKILTTLKYANNAVLGVKSSMSKGYSAEAVISGLEEAKQAIIDYEKTSGITWTDNTEDTVEKLIADAEAFKAEADRNVGIGNNIGLSLQLPMQGELTAVAESTGAGMIVISNNTSSIQELQCLFNGTITESESDRMVVSTLDRVIVTYSGEMNTNLTAGTEVKQGDVLGDVLIGHEMHIGIQVDGVDIDPLRVFGSTGIQLKKEYLATHDDKDAHELINVKDYPEMDNLIKYIDDGSIDAQYIE